MTHGRAEISSFGQWLQGASQTITPAGVEGVTPPGEPDSREGEGEELHDARDGRANGETNRQDICGMYQRCALPAE